MMRFVMRNIVVLSLIGFSLNCWTAGAWAQPAASRLAAPKDQGALNVWGSDATFRQRVGAGVTIAETYSNDKLGSGDNLGSAAMALPESVRMSAQNPTNIDASKLENLKQTDALSPGRASIHETAKTLSVRTDLNRL
jgi:hypothetical protein